MDSFDSMIGSNVIVEVSLRGSVICNVEGILSNSGDGYSVRAGNGYICGIVWLSKNAELEKLDSNVPFIVDRLE